MVAPISSGPKIHQIIVVGSLSGLMPGHAVVIDATGVKARWDGSAPTATEAIGIVTVTQMPGDKSVSVLRTGDFIRQGVALADGSALSAAQDFILSQHGLWSEGAW
ncbi:hypothetical protein AT251_07860 [Enterovibrio nigricans]|nr:hypothetical protein AT251_07860 [Enterovibrio nigricans]